MRYYSLCSILQAQKWFDRKLRKVAVISKVFKINEN
jgi:hypothetical protein